MADGSAHFPSGTDTDQPVGRLRTFARWLVGKRQGMLTIWASVAGLALTVAIALQFFGPVAGYLSDKVLLTALIGAGTLLVLPLLLLSLDPSDNFQKGPRRLLPLLSLCLFAGLAALVAWDSIMHAGWFASAGHGAGSKPLAPTPAQVGARIVLFAYLVVGFIPGIWNAANFARFDKDQRDQVAKAAKLTQANGGDAEPDTLDDDADAMGALVGTLIVLFVGALAIFAGAQFGGETAPKFENVYGLILCAVVIGVFVVVVFLDVIAESAPVRAMTRLLRAVAKRLRFLATFYEWVDTGLVRIGASVAGMGQGSVKMRYLVLAGTLACLSTMAWFLPPPLGLVPAFAGFAVAISVSRLWAWVEDDRALASMTEYKHDAPYRIGFREDFRDETLLGFIFIFVLTPIAMMQAHVGEFFGPDLFETPEKVDFLTWFGFFGVELAKAVPIVDWAEIYDIGAGQDVIAFESAAGRHAVFLARVMVDMVLIAALLQAVGITSRNRHQKRLFRAGHIKRLDEFVERNELTRAIRMTRRRHMGAIRTDLKGKDALEKFNLSKLGRDGLVDFRKYDRDRLFHIYGSTEGHLERRAFVAAIAQEAGLTLLNAIELTQKIAETTRNQVDMYAAFQRAIEEHTSGVRRMDVDDLYLILQDIRLTAGLKDFKLLLIDWMTKVGEPTAVVEKLAGLGIGKASDRFQYARNRIAAVIIDLTSQIKEIAILEEVYAMFNADTAKDQRPSDSLWKGVVETIREEIETRFPSGAPPQPSSPDDRA